jgi:enoyl-CoA hydratase
MNPAVMGGLGNGLNEAENNSDIRAVIITATGDRAFCAGMDLKGFAEGTNTVGADLEAGFKHFINWMRNGVDVPVICAVNGTAVAGGFELMMASDMVVASRDAKFGVPEVKRGLFAAGGGVFLAKRIPAVHAYELCLTGDTIPAERAYELGLLNYLVDPADVMPKALELAARITANGPLAIKATKKLVRAGVDSTSPEGWALLDSLRDEVFQSEDAIEGARAFVEKREPQWKGR